MKEASLPSPGVGSKSMHLRRIAANAISALEVSAPRYSNGAHPTAAALVSFFNACSAAAATIGKAIATMVLTTAGGATTVAVGATLTTTFSKGSSTGAVSYSSSNANIATVNGAGVITGVAVGNVTITAAVTEGTAHKAGFVSVAITVIAA